MVEGVGQAEPLVEELLRDGGAGADLVVQGPQVRVQRDGPGVRGGHARLEVMLVVGLLGLGRTRGEGSRREACGHPPGEHPAEHRFPHTVSLAK